MIVLQTVLLAAFPILVIMAALTDVTSFTIPNRISVLLILMFFPAALAMGRPIGEIGMDVVVFAAALLAGMAMFAVGWVGGGDAKLLAAASLWLGLAAMPVFLISTALIGGVLAVALMNVRSSWARIYLTAAPPWLARLATPGAEVPYGVAIATGALAAFPQTSLAHALHGGF
ncbi:MAG TPA: prepilin peptidase [Caulobacteraceae bacterium]|jgi:prepilin peptidase CpaA|nr:prepilin peptidase [Caulobacteraceae bacterium]